MKRLILLFLTIFTACTTEQPYSSFKVPTAYQPVNEIPLNDLVQYKIAYCWTPPVQSLDEDDNQEVDVVISSGDGSSRHVISTRELKLHQSPFLPEQTGHPQDYDLGCFSTGDFDIRYSGNELFWRPKENELAFVAGVNPFLADFRLFEIQDNMNYIEVDFPFTDYDYITLFDWPRGIYWSPDGEKFATLGSGKQSGDLGNNIWAYDFKQQKFRRITNFTRVGNELTTASWSNDGKKLAIGYGGPESGVGITSYEGSQDYVEITSKATDQLSSWPYWLDSSWGNFLRALAEGKDSTERFNAELVFNSTPVWINHDQNIIFTAANREGRATLFMVDADGTNLRELLPGLPGITLMPRLSPDGNTLAFARFPSWNDRSRVEVAVLGLKNMKMQTLAIFQEPSDQSILFINGMDWSPDGKYLMLGAHYEDELDIFVVTKDGKSWINLTKNLDGDAVSPAWKK